MTRTYSAAVSKPPTRTIECQTEMTWLNREKPEKATTPVKSLEVADPKKFQYPNNFGYHLDSGSREGVIFSEEAFISIPDYISLKKI